MDASFCSNRLGKNVILQYLPQKIVLEKGLSAKIEISRRFSNIKEAKGV